MKLKSISTIILLLAFALAGCKKKTQEPEPDGSSNSNTPTGTFYLHLHTNIEDNEVEDYDVIDTMSSGRLISLSLAQTYISEIELIKLDGSSISLSGKTILKVIDNEEYLVGEAPVGNYKSVRFKVGLDGSTNAADPLSSPDSSILNRSEMWFGNAAQPDGYVFVNLQGKIDTSSAGNGTAAQMQDFAYKIGTNVNHKQITMPEQNFVVASGQDSYVHIAIDYYQLFNGINLNNSANLSVISASDNANAAGLIVSGNIASMFKYAE